MEKEKPKSLTENLTSTQKYIPTNSSTAPNPEMKKEEFDKLKKKLIEFSKKVKKKFAFTKVLGILPGNSFKMFEEDESLPKEVIDSKPLHIIMIIPEEKFKELNKIKQDVIQLAKETGENIWVHIKTAEVDLWNYGLDSKFEFVDAIGTCFPLYDDGFLGALRVASIHKNLVLNWLNSGRTQYVASYVIAGSLTRGTADEKSDVDTFVIIDDTDVKRMSRIELLEKLRRKITSDFIQEATALAGTKNILNVQVYLLTDFWQSVKDAQPVMFTFIRDGVPLFDRGTFIPWKRLLQMGKIKPSPEAIDLYMKEGDRTKEIVRRRMLDAMVDIYFGVVTPTQAMMMLAGQAPPVPKTIVQEVRETLVKKEKVMTEKELKTLERVVKLYKDYEHGKLKTVPGKEIDELLEESAEYTKKMITLRTKLEEKMMQHQIEQISADTFKIMKNIFGNKGQEALLKDLEIKIVKKGEAPERILTIAKEISKLKRKTKNRKSDQSEMQRLSRDAAELTDALTEYAQRKELINIEKNIIQITFNDTKADLILSNKKVFVTQAGKPILELKNKKLVEVKKEELEKAIAESKDTTTLSSETIELLKKELGNFEIVL